MLESCLKVLHHLCQQVKRGELAMTVWVIYHAAGTRVVHADTREQVFDIADDLGLDVDYVIEKDQQHSQE